MTATMTDVYDTDWDNDRSWKSAVRRAVTIAIQEGVLEPAITCSDCGGRYEGRALDAHHHNGYHPDHAFDVIWMHQRCHQRIHGGAVTVLANLPPERRSEIGRAGAAGMLARTTAGERLEKARRAAAAYTTGTTHEERSEISRRAAAKVSLLHRRQRTRKAVCVQRHPSGCECWRWGDNLEYEV